MLDDSHGSELEFACRIRHIYGMSQEVPLQHTIVTRALSWMHSLWRVGVIRHLLVLGLYSLLTVIATFQFVRNHSNPMLAEELHQHHNEELPHSHMSGVNAKSWARFPAMVEGTAYKPYVSRAFMPILIRGVRSVVPESTQTWLEQELYTGKTVQLSLTEIGLDWEQDYFTEYVILMGLLFLMLIGFCYSLRYLFRAVYDGPEWLEILLPIVAILSLPPFFELYGSYIYDFAGLFLFTLGLALIVQRRWIAYLIVFALGTINKETTVLLTISFCMFHTFSGRVTWKTFFALSLAQVFIFLGIKLAISMAFAENDGGATEFHLLRNISKFPRYGIGSIVAALVVTVVAAYDWNAKPLFLRSALVILVPLIILTFFFGYFDELRDYYEAFPIVLLLLTHSVAKYLNIPLETRPNARSV